jgi:hypothetical protein
MKIENNFKWYIDNVRCHGLCHIVSIPNGHIPLGGSIGLYATKLDLIKKFIWFKCCKA